MNYITLSDVLAATPLSTFNNVDWGLLDKNDIDAIQSHLISHEEFNKPLQDTSLSTTNTICNGIIARLRHKSIELKYLLTNQVNIYNNLKESPEQVQVAVSTPNTQVTDIYGKLDYVDRQGWSNAKLTEYEAYAKATQLVEFELIPIYDYVRRFLALDANFVQYEVTDGD